MRPTAALASVLLIAATCATSAQVPDNLVVQGVPPLPPALQRAVGPYVEFRAAAFQGWHPTRRELLVTTRFADTPQLHLVKMPGGQRQQLTFFAEPVAGGSFQPKTGAFIVFAQDTGGGEFYQLYRLDPANGQVTLLTDGKSRNSGPQWSHGGQQFAYTSTRRNGRDTDVYVMDPSAPQSDRLLCALTGGGWSVLDWSPDDGKLLLGEYISINESRLHLADAITGARELLTPLTGEKVAWGQAQFAKDGKSLFVTTDQGSEFQRLCRLDLATRKLTPLGPAIRGDVESFDLSRDGKTLAFVSNEDGVSVLHLLNAETGRALRTPKLPLAVIGRLAWHENSRNLAFTMNSAQSPSDVFSLDLKTGKMLWQEHLDARFQSSPVVVGDELYLFDQSGACFRIAAADEYKLLRQSSMPRGFSASPAFAHGRIYIRSDKHLYCIGGK
mgnify:CR=1 FL=1